MRQLFFAVIIILSAVSCELESEIDLDLPVEQAQPVVVCFASPSQATVAYLSQTLPLNSSMNIAPVPTVLSFRVMQDTHLVGTLHPTAEYGLFQSEGALALEEHLPYHIEVQTVEFGTIRSRDEFLPNAAATDTVFLKDSTFNLAGYFDIAVVFSDNALYKNHYASKSRYFKGNIELVDSTAQYRHLPLFSFDDSEFNGTSHLFELKVPKMIYNTEAQKVSKAEIMLYSLSPSLFAFLSSISQNEGTFSDVIVEPVPVVSNILNGHGVFGLYQSDTTQINL